MIQTALSFRTSELKWDLLSREVRVRAALRKETQEKIAINVGAWDDQRTYNNFFPTESAQE